MTNAFDRDLIERLRSVREVEIGTSMPQGGTPHRTIIWVVVDEHDRVLIRTFRGPGSRWYREALANPECILHVGADAVAVTALPARDPARIAACSHGFLAKYSNSSSTIEMIAPDNLPTTLELLPR